jgi:hypothetical protein
MLRMVVPYEHVPACNSMLWIYSIRRLHVPVMATWQTVHMLFEEVDYTVIHNKYPSTVY